MKSKKIERPAANKPYPKLLTAKNGDYTVFMVECGSGMIVNIADDEVGEMFFLGAYRSDWLEYAFTEYTGSIVLEN